MPRAIRVLTRDDVRSAPIADTLLLSFDQRRMQKGMVFGEKGTAVELDFEQPAQLRTDDVLLLEDGRLVEVVADAEMLIEIRAADARSLARLAWTLGERHVPAHIFPNRLRIRRAPETEALVAALAIKGNVIHAPFEPESDVTAGHECGDYQCGHDHTHG